MGVIEKINKIEEELNYEINRTRNESVMITVSVNKNDSVEIQETLKEKGYESSPMLSWSNEYNLLVVNKFQK